MSKSSEGIIYFIISIIKRGTLLMIDMKYPRKNDRKRARKK